MSRRGHDEEPINVEMTDGESGLAPDVDELQSEVDRLRQELETERQKTKDEHEQCLRAMADFSNYRRRHQDEYAQAIQFASQEVILKLLPVIDNFERALAAVEQNHSYESLVEGVKLTLRQLKDLLEREGVKPIEAVGQEFDPMKHEAVMRVETNDYPENTIVEEVQTGYTQRDKVIRPARVTVAASPE